MKANWLVTFGALISTSLLAQQVTNAPAAAPLATPPPAPALTNAAAPAAPAPAPAAKSDKKKAPAKKKPAAEPKKKDPAAELRTVPLLPGPAIVDANHVNVRGQPKLKSEVITRLNKGQPVVVLEEIVRNNSAADEPSAWAKILLPTNAHAWVSTAFIEAANKTVLPKKLNLRSGPGENYSVLGTLLHGETVKDLGTKGTWTEIEAPTNAYAFVAAQFLKQETPGAIAAMPAETPAEPSTITEPATIAAAPTEPPAAATNAAAGDLAAATNALAEASTNAPAAEEPPPKRIVQREGIVRGTTSIQAPTRFALYSPANGRLIDYLYTTSPNLDLRRYKGLHIVVTGEEGIEERWGNNPVITIQRIQPLDE
jgi:uncharacterized protein YgiM (DUF1202 family)